MIAGKFGPNFHLSWPVYVTSSNLLPVFAGSQSLPKSQTLDIAVAVPVTVPCRGFISSGLECYWQPLLLHSIGLLIMSTKGNVDVSFQLGLALGV